jgi:transcriptional regulator with XRE-family HTH domain
MGVCVDENSSGEGIKIGEDRWENAGSQDREKRQRDGSIEPNFGRITDRRLENQICLRKICKAPNTVGMKKITSTTGKRPARTRVVSPFAANLKTILAERGVTMRGAAEVAGVNHSVVNDWLAGSQPSDPMAVLRLCRALKCDYQWLMTGTHPEATVKEMALNEIFEVKDEPDFSGIFVIEAKRLKRRGDPV